MNWYSLSAFKGWGVVAEVSFVEVVEEPVMEAVGAARYRVEVGAVTIEVGDDFRSETLQRLVRVAAAC